MRNALLVFLGLVVLTLILINVTGVQNFLARRAVTLLAEKLHTKVSLKHVRVDFANRLLLQGLYIEDQQKDTLLYAGEVELKITDWFFMKKDVPVITYLGLHNTYGHLYRTAQSKTWNYQFVIDAFDTGPKDTSKSENEFEMDLKHLDLANVRFHSDDAWTGDDMDIDVGSATLDGKEIDLKKRRIDMSRIAIEGTTVAMRSYKGGRPPRPKRVGLPPIDTTAFNPGGWVVKVQELSLEDCGYSLLASTKPAPAREFDPDHMNITGIDIEVNGLRIQGDTIKARLQHLAANERCGIAVRELSGDVTVSPNASIVDNLLLTTNYSTVRRRYAMLYERFPDFEDYIDKVRMEVDLQDASVDPRDVAYFAPVFLEYFPRVMKASGRFAGTVADFGMRDIRVNDGVTSVTGNVTMKGLPDIYKTIITFTEGSVYTNGTEVARFAPQLKGNPAFDIRQLSHIQYTGSFIGYIDNFAANGLLRTNLGIIASRSKLNMPGFEMPRANYNSEIVATDFQLGRLLGTPEIGTVSFKGTISGTGFDPGAAVKVNAFINHLGLNGYNYSNINADGVLARKKFDGKILVNDPNLALSFNGTADFSGKEPVLMAKAYLLQSNLQALHLIDEPIEASGDIDMNATGSTIDNFLGSILLNNIDVRRAGHRLDIDSLFIQSSIASSGNKQLLLESNDFTALIDGKYQLSKLPYSVQYFLSRYLPSYIRAPKSYAPDQNLSFAITTKDIDSLLIVLAPNLAGFNNTTITGSLNTTLQQLALNAKVPYGRINGVKMNNVTLHGDGNFERIKVTGDAADIIVGDSLVQLSLNLNTTVGQDSILYNITTSSPYSYGTATLNGVAVAKSDFIYLQMAPSEFFFNQARWEIAGGSDVVIGHQYLSVKDLHLRSGLQEVSIYSEDERNSQALVIQASNIDLAQIGNGAGLSSYQPDGRIAGSVRISDLYRAPSATASIRATGVKLGADTIGDVVVIGTYSGQNKVLRLESGSGIFRGVSSINADGTVSFDSTSNQHLDGKITIRNAPLSWVSPLLEGYVSNISGTVNGDVKITGTGRMPDIDGDVRLTNAGMKIDYLGTYYTIPTATIALTNNDIRLGSIEVRDVLDNKATLTGRITHERFTDFRLGLQMKSDEFEVLNLKDYENSLFYGHLVANVKSMSVSGPVNNVQMNIRAEPADLSHLYLPIATGGDVGTYTYVSFKKYGEEQLTFKPATTNKLSINIDATLNPLAEITLIMDPTTGDEINARGNGNIKLEVPASGDLKMFGNIKIDEGDYTFTFRQLFFKRQFQLASGSSVNFSGPMNQTTMDVTATYRTRASLYDLLSEAEKNNSFIPSNELSDTKRQQDVDVQLTMRKNILHPDISFKLSLPEKRSVGTYAYTKFERLNNNERDLFNQVASLLLIGYFIPPEGLGGSTAATGAINNISEILSTNTSAQLTNIVNKVLNDPKLSVDLKYKNYNISDNTATGPINRNEVKLGLRQNLLNDRLVLEVGSSYDWGRPVSTSASSSNFNLLNDFRIQYLLSKDGRLRLNGFRTTDYDVLLNNGTNITRSGVGVSWRKTFDSFDEFIHSSRYFSRQKHILEEQQKIDSNTIKRTIGTE